MIPDEVKLEGLVAIKGETPLVTAYTTLNIMEFNEFIVRFALMENNDSDIVDRIR